MISQQTCLMLFVAATLSMGTIIAMEGSSQQTIEKNDLRNTFSINEEEILSLIQCLRNTKETNSHIYNIPHTKGSSLTISSPLCNPSQVTLEIEEGIYAISLSSTGDKTIKIEAFKDFEKILLTTLKIIANEK